MSDFDLVLRGNIVLADQIIESQRREIAEMEALIRELEGR